MRRRWLAPLLSVPMLAGGCATAAGTPVAVPSPSGTPWVVVSSGSATPSPTPSGYTATAQTFPTGFLPTPTDAAATPTGSSSSCAPDSFHGINGATVVPSTTSAAVTWWNPGGDDVVEYRVTAISQDVQVGDQRDVGWTVVTPGATCGFLTATVTGLDRRTRYVFSVDVVLTRLANDGTRAATVARSVVTSTT